MLSSEDCDRDGVGVRHLLRGFVAVESRPYVETESSAHRACVITEGRVCHWACVRVCVCVCVCVRVWRALSLGITEAEIHHLPSPS